MASTFPDYAWDSHIHVIEPYRFPMSPDRDYTPKPAPKQKASEFQSSRGIAHSVVVLPSVYGTDNRVLIDALKYFNGSARGVCVVDPDTVTDETLDELHAVGIRRIRVNFGSDGTNDEIVKEVVKNAKVAEKRNWVLQVWLPLHSFVALHSIIPSLGVTIVSDHYGHAEVGSKTHNPRDTIDPYQQPGFPEFLDLVRRRLLFVKLSAPYQNSDQAPLYTHMRVVAQTIIMAAPDMVVYGSDWPHTGSKEGNEAAGGRLHPQEYRDINDPAIVEVVKNWAGSDDQIQRIFVDNPRRLWQWDDLDSELGESYHRRRPWYSEASDELGRGEWDALSGVCR